MSPFRNPVTPRGPDPRRGLLGLSRESCRCWLLGWGFAALIAAGLLLLVLGGCSEPMIDGPQITKHPAGFVFDANATAARLVFTDREKLDQLGYMTLREDYHCSIMITEYEGLATSGDAQAAREASFRWYGEYDKLDPVQATEIDEQPAWGWFTRMYDPDGLRSMRYTAVVAHEETATTYTVEFFAADPKFMTEDALLEIVKSFHVEL